MDKIIGCLIKNEFWSDPKGVKSAKVIDVIPYSELKDKKDVNTVNTECVEFDDDASIAICRQTYTDGTYQDLSIDIDKDFLSCLEA